jgi:hypothetical protein
MDKNAKLMAALAMTAITAMLFTAGNVFANPQTDDPSGWGKLTSGAASSDGKSFGDHASSQDTPRLGLGNVLGAVTGDSDASKHPSELGQFLCSNFAGTFPCP